MGQNISADSDQSDCPVGGERALTLREVALVRSMFGNAIDCRPVRLKRRRWFPFQPAGTLMAPTGHIHFHERSPHYCEDFGSASLDRQGLFIHEMTHVWQTQAKGKWYLPLLRNFSPQYSYTLKPGWRLERYGIEQQAEIVRHAFLLRSGAKVAGAPDPAAYDLVVDFPGATLRR